MIQPLNKDPQATLSQEGTINIKITSNKIGYENSITPYTNDICSSLGKRGRDGNYISMQQPIKTNSLCSRPERLCEQIRSCRNKLHKTEMESNADTIDHQTLGTSSITKQGLEVKKFIIHSDTVLKNQVKLRKKILMNVKRKEKRIKREENKTFHILEDDSSH